MKVQILPSTESPVLQNEVISKIRDLINYKNLEPGDKIPSERMLSDKFEVTRSVIRESIQKLEFYGLLKSIPQSGTFIADIGIVALNGMVDDILNLKKSNFKSLIETRILLELRTVELAAVRRDKQDLTAMRTALDDYNRKVVRNEDAFQEDLLFHLAITKASRNSTMNVLMLMITPEIITNFEKHLLCDSKTSQSSMAEHEQIYNAINNKDKELAKMIMKKHFKALYQYCDSVNTF